MNYISENLPGGHKVYIHLERFDKVCIGGTRVRKYLSDEEALDDCKRLCLAMGYKCAWARLPWFGAKAVINADNSDLTKDDWNAYARELNMLGGCFITATDVGTTINDIEYLKSMTPYVSTIDTTNATAKVVINCMNTVANKINIPIDTVLIQGVGKIGSLIAKNLYDLGCPHIFICDIDESRCNNLKKLDPKVFQLVSPNDIDMKVDYLVPCTAGTLVTRDNFSDLKASVICGAANNQLEEDNLADRLHERGILYVPDFIANSGGLLNMAISEVITSPDSIDAVSYKLELLLFKFESFDKSLLSIAKDQCRRRLFLVN
ncbi:hypothetical protein MYX76_07205 [Desulfobacterota bacterium AH_259_B03_O07]|nr:hypothetical protein [Desulfobacterota bacterium AH_259_B03_O07]